MANMLPIKNAGFTFYTGLTSQADTDILQVNPTLAAGDVQVSIDGGAFANLDTLPVVTPAGGKAVKVVLTTDEMNGDNIIVVFSDAAGDEWQDVMYEIRTESQQIGVLAVEASVEGHVDASLASYDPPTKAELDSAVAALAIEANVEGHADAALASYDPPTRAEATADKNAIITEVDANETKIDALPTASAIATAVWAAGTRTLTSFGTLIADIWAYVTRTLTLSAAQIAAVVSGSDISVMSYSTWDIDIAGLGSLASRTEIYFTVKTSAVNDADTASIAQVRESVPGVGTDGLLYIDGAAAADNTKGSLVVTDEVAGDLTVTVDASVTGITPKDRIDYDVKIVTASAVIVLATGDFTLAAPSTRAIT